MSDAPSVNSAVIEEKNNQRKLLEADVDAFLARGGKIQQANPGASGGGTAPRNFVISGFRDAARLDALDQGKPLPESTPAPALVKRRRHAPALPDIRREIQEGFRKKGTSLQKWALQQNLQPARLSQVLKSATGAKSIELRKRVVAAMNALPDAPVAVKPIKAKSAARLASDQLDLRRLLEWWIKEEKKKGHPIYISREGLAAALIAPT